MILLFLACTGAESEPEPLVDTAPPYERPRSEWDGEQAAAAAQAVLNTGIPTAPPVAYTWMDLVDAGATASCPDRVDYSMLDAPFGCAAETGYYFSGMTALKFEDELGGFEFLCDAYVIDPQGRTYWCGGESILLGGEQFLFMHLIGTFGYEGVAPWEDGRQSVALWADFNTEDPDLGPVLNLMGSVDSSQGSIAFDNLAWSYNQEVVLGGGIGVRSDHGWYRAILGPAGCSAWVHESGNAVGQGCLDLEGPLNDWLEGSLK